MSIPIAREFINGPWHNTMRAVTEQDQYVSSCETIRHKETLIIDGIPREIAVFSQVHFIYELDTDGDMVCLVAGTRDDCEMAIARKLAEE